MALKAWEFYRGFEDFEKVYFDRAVDVLWKFLADGTLTSQGRKY